VGKKGIIMKKYSLKIAAALWLPVLGSSPAASANSQDQSLGSGPSVVDRYRVACSTANGADTAGLAFQVKNNTPSSPALSAQAYKASSAANTTDAASGDTVFSPMSYLAQGNGTYFVAVDKAGTGALNYTLFYQCVTSQGAATGTAISIRQDQ
jgi:hypothetical protein